mmetsp:Transcript_23900/g.74434  ORF Transcript_23900/g.74434 Transcript_23900/m.74434 type:complete len:341 (+) Transcript_23900:39-1061(+)
MSNEAYAQCLAPSTWADFHCDRDDADRFYTSVLVTESYDGTYFSAINFSSGYMGIQDRNPKWVIFSCWDQPGYPVEKVEVGKLTKTDCFRGEGTGWKSWIEFDWQLGVTYSMCVKCEEGCGGKTKYSGYFMHPDHGWILIASFLAKNPEGPCHTVGRKLGAFCEDWLSDSKNGGHRRSCVYGPALIHYASQDSWYSCRSCHGTSNDTRQPIGYLNREVKCHDLAASMCIGGTLDLAETLFHGNLQTHVVPAPSIALLGDGEYTGIFCAGSRFINGELYYQCLKPRVFIAYDGSTWHIVPMQYLEEIIQKQGKFGSVDHRTNCDVRICESKWSQYQLQAAI